MIESIVSDLDPELSILDTIKPFGEKLLRKRYKPKSILQNTWSELVENAHVVFKNTKESKRIDVNRTTGEITF